MKQKIFASLSFLLAAFLFGHFLTVGMGMFNEATARAEFCGLCHGSITSSEAYKTSNHRMNQLGISAECGDCHIRDGLYAGTWDHVSSGLRSLFLGIAKGHLTDPELQNELGETMAQNTRDWLVSVDASPCMHCHNDPMSGRPSVTWEHEKAQRQGISCIGCHYNLVHDAQPVRESFKKANAIKDDH